MFHSSCFGVSLANFVQFAQGVVRRIFVDVSQGRIVEYRVDEEIYAAAEAQAGQSDVNELARDLANDMYSQEFAAGSLEDHFDHTFGVADDLAARVIAVFVLTDDVRKIFVFAFFFGFADLRDLWNRIDAGWKNRRELGFVVQAEGV